MLIEKTIDGLYCPAGDFYIDPWGPVDRALITHAHPDRARAGSGAYLTAESGVELLRYQVGSDTYIQGQPYGKPITIEEVSVTFVPAGHILGSAQIRIESGREVYVVSGDYKLASDPTCEPFEPVRCNVFLTEATFGLPVFQWRPPRATFSQIDEWWLGNQAEGRTSVLFATAMGKAQRLLAGLDAGMGPIFAHDGISKYHAAYSAAGIDLPATSAATPEAVGRAEGRGLIIAPPAAARSAWLDSLGPVATALAAGWLQVRGALNRYPIELGLVFANHADWGALTSAIQATEADEVYVTHGKGDVLVRWLRQHGMKAGLLETQFEGEAQSEPAELEDAVGVDVPEALI